MANTFSETVNNFYEKGLAVEYAFASDLLKSEGGQVWHASQHDDIINHIDVFWSNGNKEYSFDVKGARKKSRYDSDVSYKTTWLEIQNVNGQCGSLLGNQDYIAFELEDQWAIVNRKQLLFALINKLDDKTLYTSNPNEDFKLYQRSGRQDIIVRVPYEFIISNTSKLIKKNA
jgi:hypothetical protein